MSSPSPIQSGYASAHAQASSSRSPLSASPPGDDLSDDGLEIRDEELFEEDPLHESGGSNGKYVYTIREYMNIAK